MATTMIEQKTISEGYQKQGVTETRGKPRKTGIDLVGDVPWGTHLCQFYQTKEDLIDILVPYFKAGLENNEFCMWVMSEPLGEKDAREAMRRAMPNFGRYLKKGQIEIIPHSEWYLKNGSFDLKRVLSAWLDKLNQALAKGYDGMRVTGNTAWLEKRDWKRFADYEHQVDNAIGSYRMIAICTYSLDKCGASEIIDVVGNHRLALIRREGNWELNESSERKQAEKALKESEEKFRTFMETASDLMNMTDKDGKYTYANDSMVRTLGYSKEELIGMHITRVLTKEALEKDFKPNWGKFLANGEMSIETTLLTKEGKEIYCEIKAVAIYDSDGNYVGSRGVHHDITERKQAEEAMRESEEKYRSLFETMLNGVAYCKILVDKDNQPIDYVHLEVNSAWERLVGLKSEDVIGKKITEVIPGIKESKTNLISIYGQVALTGESTEIELHFEPLGKWFYISVYSPAKGYFVAVFEDITERKKREKLQHDENYVLTLLGRGAELSELLDAIVCLGEYNDPSIKGSVLLLDPSREYLVHASAPSLPDDFNELLKYGLPIGPNVGSCGTAAYLKERVIVTDIENSPLFKPFEEAVKRAISSGLLAVWSQPIISSNGDLLGTIANYSNKVGEPNADGLRMLEWSVRIAAIAIERKLAEEALRESEARFKNLAEQSPNMIFINEKGRTVYANKRCEAIMGYTREEFCSPGFDFFTIIAPESRDLVKANFNRHMKDEAIHPYEYVLLTKDGKRIEAILSTALMEWEGRTAILGIVTDITNLKQSEQREKQLQQELNLSSRLASVGEMASGVAHEINNPLTSVIGFSQLLLGRGVADDVRRDLEVINSQSQRVAKIVAGLLAFARQQKPGKEHTDINSILMQVLKLRAYEMEVNNIEVLSQLSPDLPFAMADAGQLQQVFLNIIINAEKEMTKSHSKGRLLVKSEKVDDVISISFTDDGPGIDKENLGKIFDPFFTTKEVGEGTGLGLSICHGVITAHNGRIYAESELGKGATLIIEMPIVADTEQVEDTEVAEEETWHGRGSKILVVDDETMILDFLKRLLTDQGYEVETVDRVNAALEKIDSQKYDLILMDIKLPGMNGIELYHHIKATDPALVDRIVFVTGDVMESTTRDFLATTKAAHISKPISIEQLKKGINSILTMNLKRQGQLEGVA